MGGDNRTGPNLQLNRTRCTCQSWGISVSHCNVMQSRSRPLVCFVVINTGH